MRIALRTSGGRGEYELAGTQGNILASNLFGKQLLYEFTPSIVIPGRATANIFQGKPRIRLNQEHLETTTHLYRLLAAVLLLPKPKREFKQTNGINLLATEAYSMTGIKVDVSRVEQDAVVLRPTDILVENVANLRRIIGFAGRMSRVTRLWEVAFSMRTPLATFLRAHMTAVAQPDPDHKTIGKRADAIAKFLDTRGDTLLFAEEQLGTADASLSEQTRPDQSPHDALPQGFSEEDTLSPAEARIERIKQWREIAVRGSASARFRNAVTDQYNFRCMFSGKRYPKTDATNSAGVDAAHILPWSTHELNSVANGLCLDKLSHWAFDAGVVRLTFDAAISSYVVQIPDSVRKVASIVNFDLAHFESLAGPIPRHRLPRNQDFWPRPEYLEELNKFTGLN